jgi:protein-L-isoaspartate(D-aspartate) O-methyltransferase
MDFAAERARLIEHLRAEITDENVLAVMGKVPRERFVPPDIQHEAYVDISLSIGHNQTISQPLIVAMMTQALRLTGTEKVLEVGTGSGYQTAVLAELSRIVITTERIAALAESAKIILDSLGYTNIKYFPAGEILGLSSEAPYDAIIITAGAPQVPDELLAQLTIGGRMVIPVGSRLMQRLYQVIKGREHNTINDLGGCAFVPLISKAAWDK